MASKKRAKALGGSRRATTRRHTLRIKLLRPRGAFHVIVQGTVARRALRLTRSILLLGAMVTVRGPAQSRISREDAAKRLGRIRVKTWNRGGLFGNSVCNGISVAPISSAVADRLVKVIGFAARKGGPFALTQRLGHRQTAEAADESDITITDEEAADDADNADVDVVVTDEEADEDASIADTVSDVVISDEEADQDWNAFIIGDEPGLVAEPGIEVLIDWFSDGLAVAWGAAVVDGALEAIGDLFRD